jgi:hypothetical protein
MQLISYIALAAPATRRPATGYERFLRPEFGFTPKWYRDALGIDFGKAWHRDPAVRLRSIQLMGREVRRRFPGIPIGCQQDPDAPADILTGTFGACIVPALYGVPIEYQPENWPWSQHQYLSDDQASRLEPVNLDDSPLFGSLLAQLDWIAAETGRLAGYLNWQGVLNNAYRLRGEDLFVDMAVEPERACHVFECVAQTMIEGAHRLYARQRQEGFDVRHFTVSNCLVNLVSPGSYRNLVFPFDKRVGDAFSYLGVHNCAWNATPYIEHYAELPSVAYIDMGMDSDLERARRSFPTARRAIMYTPMDVANKSSAQLRADLEAIARRFGPCDVVFADIESGTPDARVLELASLCDEISESYEFA